MSLTVCTMETLPSEGGAYFNFEESKEVEVIYTYQNIAPIGVNLGMFTTAIVDQDFVGVSLRGSINFGELNITGLTLNEKYSSGEESIIFENQVVDDAFISFVPNTDVNDASVYELRFNRNIQNYEFNLIDEVHVQITMEITYQLPNGSTRELSIHMNQETAVSKIDQLRIIFFSLLAIFVLTTALSIYFYKEQPIKTTYQSLLLFFYAIPSLLLLSNVRLETTRFEETLAFILFIPFFIILLPGLIDHRDTSSTLNTINSEVQRNTDELINEMEKEEDLTEGGRKFYMENIEVRTNYIKENAISKMVIYFGVRVTAIMVLLLMVWMILPNIITSTSLQMAILLLVNLTIILLYPIWRPDIQELSRI